MCMRVHVLGVCVSVYVHMRVCACAYVCVCVLVRVCFLLGSPWYFRNSRLCTDYIINLEQFAGLGLRNIMPLLGTLFSFAVESLTPATSVFLHCYH